MLLILSVSSCYKLDNGTSPPEGFDVISGFVLDTIIPERKVLWGSINGAKSEYHYSLDRSNGLAYTLPSTSYYYSSDFKLLSLRSNGTDRELFDLKNGNTVKVLSDFNNKALALADGKLYAMGPETNNISYLKIHDIASNFALIDSFQIRGSYLKVSRDGSMIYCQTFSSGPDFMSVLSFENNKIKDLLTYEMVGINLLDGVSMSDDGKLFVLPSGRIYNNNLEVQKDFSDDKKIYYISADGQKLFVKNYFNNVTVFEASKQFDFGNEIFFNEIFDASIQKVIPFTKSDGTFLAVSMFDAVAGQQTVFFKVK